MVEQRRGLAPQGARPPLVTLAMETNEARLSEIEVTGTKVGDLLRPCPGVVEKEQKSAIPATSRPGG